MLGLESLDLVPLVVIAGRLVQLVPAGRRLGRRTPGRVRAEARSVLAGGKSACRI